MTVHVIEIDKEYYEDDSIIEIGKCDVCKGPGPVLHIERGTDC